MPRRRYVYGIIRTDEPVLFELGGVEPEHEVFSVGEGGLAVVTSAVERASFAGLERAEAVSLLAAHQRVLETVQRDYPVLPVKFGTVLDDEARLLTLLRRGQGLLGETLAAYAGKEQYEVVVLWELARVFQQIAAAPQVAALKAQIVALPPEQLEQGKLLLGQVVHAALQERRTAIASVARGVLGGVAETTLEQPAMDDSMVCNLALLLSQEQQGDLDTGLVALDERLGGELHIRCVGPLPPYSFTNLEVQQPRPAVVAAAREALGLGEQTSLAAIKGAYRRLAARLHPDHNPDPASPTTMETLSEAYRLLTAVAQAQAPAGAAGDWPCRLDHEALAGTLILALRRHELGPTCDER